MREHGDEQRRAEAVVTSLSWLRQSHAPCRIPGESIDDGDYSGSPRGAGLKPVTHLTGHLDPAVCVDAERGGHAEAVGDREPVVRSRDEKRRRGRIGELGIGLRYAISPNFHLTFDIRAGSRATVSDDRETAVDGTVARSVAPPTEDSNESEEYTRARLAAILYF